MSPRAILDGHPANLSALTTHEPTPARALFRVLYGERTNSSGNLALVDSSCSVLLVLAPRSRSLASPDTSRQSRFKNLKQGHVPQSMPRRCPIPGQSCVVRSTVLAQTFRSMLFLQYITAAQDRRIKQQLPTGWWVCEHQSLNNICSCISAAGP